MRPLLMRPGAEKVRLRLSLISSLLYILLCSLYVVYSDQFVQSISRTPEQYLHYQTFKGTGFVVLTGIALFSLLYFGMGRYLKAREIIRLQRESIILAEHRALTGLLSASTLHDINNVLMLIHMRLESLAREFEASQNFQKSFEKVHQNLQSIQIAVKNLLNFSRTSDDFSSIDVVDVKSVLLESWQMLNHFCKGKKIQFKIQEEFRGLRAKVNLVCFRQSLMNILLNSLMHIDLEGIIEIIIRTCPKMILLEVHDSGTAQLEDLKKSIFDPGPESIGKETGLRMIAARFCVESMGGSLEVSASHLQGCCLRLRLHDEYSSMHTSELLQGI